MSDDTTNVTSLNGRRKQKVDAWRKRLAKTEKRKGDWMVKSSIGNATLILEHHPAWRGVLGYDERNEQPVFLKPPPFVDGGDPLTKLPRPLRDADDVRTCQWLEEEEGLTLSPAQLHAALNAVAVVNRFDLVLQYLDSITWDGVPRIQKWLHTYLGAEDNDYTRAVGPRWLISAVARTRQPGCKVDHVIVYEGPQGIGKSTAVRILAGDDYFGDDIPAVGSKDAQTYIAGAWIVELAEMDAATRAEASTLKRFLTTTSDRYRPPYGRRTIVHPRRCVFAGSVNLDEYLKDSTGGRRFWPVECTRVDLEALQRDRDQLWAEADQAYLRGACWHLHEPELIGHAVEQQAKRLECDPWQDAIAGYLAKAATTFVTTAEVLEIAVGIELPRMSKRERNRVGSVMRALDWRYGEGDGRQRGWKRPEPSTHGNQHSTTQRREELSGPDA